MDIITYTLTENRHDSDAYYNKISDFADGVLHKAVEAVKAPAESFISEMKDYRGYPEEACLELLILGVCWNCYINSASGLGKIQAVSLKKISEFRQNGRIFKEGINKLKGIFSTLFLIGKDRDGALKASPELSNLDRLLRWLEASGEYRQEVKHLRLWREYLSQAGPKVTAEVISASINFARWFQKESENEIGIYTPAVGQYLERCWPEHLWKEDVVFCGRKRVEYHLNMVAAEIMNRIYHAGFIAGKGKVLLLPHCMTKPSRGKCRATSIGTGYMCSGCSGGCQINSLTRLGKKENFQVRIVPHESSIAAAKTDKSLFTPNDGVIGVSCVLNLIAGGWMLAEKGVAPQCVLLDYCGCKNHWHDTGLPTCINEKQLLKILKEKELSPEAQPRL